MMNTAFYLPALVGIVFFGIFCALALASLAGKYYERKQGFDVSNMVKEWNARVASWWVITILLLVTFWIGRGGMIALFVAASFATLREFISHVYRNRADHLTIALCFYLLLPLQYYFVLINWFSMFTVLIPVYAFLLLPIIRNMAGDNSQFFDRTAKIQWGVMITIYCLSHVPALLSLEIKDYASPNIVLLLFMLVVVQSGDVFAYLWRRTGSKIAPPRTLPSAYISIPLSTLLAASLYWITPFTLFQAALAGLMISLMGFFGNEVMRAIKRSLGIRHWGHAFSTHSVLDRLDSLCFAAPVFFHVVRYYWT